MLREVAALHPGLPRHRSDEQGPRRPVERDLRVGGRDDVREQRKRTILEFHHHAFERLEGLLDLKQTQNDGLTGAEQLARGDPEQKGVANLARGSSHGHMNGRFWRHAPTLCRAPPPPQNVRVGTYWYWGAEAFIQRSCMRIDATRLPLWSCAWLSNQTYSVFGLPPTATTSPDTS